MMKKSPSFSYHLHDNVDTAQRNFTYDFNVCDVTAVPKDSCQGCTGEAMCFQV